MSLPTPLNHIQLIFKAVLAFRVVQSCIAGLGTLSAICRSETLAKEAVMPGIPDLGGNVISS